MNLTAKIKAWLIENSDVSEDASDDEFKSAAAAAIVSGDLSLDEFKSMSVDEEDEAASDFKSIIAGLKTSLDANTAAKAAAPAKVVGPAGEKKVVIDEPEVKEVHVPSRMEKMLTSIGLQNLNSFDEDEGEKALNVRVKEAAEQYDTTKSAASYPMENNKGKKHPLAGQPMRDFDTGRPMDDASERDKAVAGAWAKYLCHSKIIKSKSLALQQLPQHDRELVLYAIENEKWGGASDGGDYADIKDRKLNPSEQKALIDDATSGGLEAAPIVFDDQIIQTPLLHGELYPLVQVKPLDRGRRVEGVATGTVTSSWGGVDDSAISLFSTTSYVSAFDTTIFRWEGAIRIGLDFLSDTPIDFGSHVSAQYGERLLEDLDDVIAAGNGTTQPEGIVNKSGASAVTFSSTTSLGNYESLRFAVPKNEHRSNVKASAVFLGTETSYMRARAIPVGASDARRLGGMSYDSYSWMERDFKINESLTNRQIMYAIMARYRMYRRRGLTMRTSTEGDTLIRNNEMLMVAMARYGGQMERGAVIGRTTDAPA
jgi:HK97 family phage major capsid protein